MQTNDSVLAAIYNALPLISIVLNVVLGFLHVKNAKAIAANTVAVIGDATSPTHGNILATLPKIITDAHAAGVAMGLTMQAPAAPAAAPVPTFQFNSEKKPNA